MSKRQFHKTHNMASYYHLTRVLLCVVLVLGLAIAQEQTNPVSLTKQLPVSNLLQNQQQPQPQFAQQRPQQPRLKVRKLAPRKSVIRKPALKQPVKRINDGDARAHYYKLKTSRFYSQYICDKKCVIKRRYFKVVNAYKKARTQLFVLNKKLYAVEKLLTKYNNNLLNAKKISNRPKRTRLLRKYRLKKKRYLRVRKSYIKKRLYLKKKLRALTKEKKIALTKLQIFLEAELNKFAQRARKQRGELMALEKARKEKDANTGNYWITNYKRLSTLKAEKQFRSKLYFKFKRDVHHLGALLRKRAHLRYQVKRQQQREEKFRATAQRQLETAKKLEKEWNAEDHASAKAKLHTSILLAQSSSDQANRRAKLASKVKERALNHLKKVDEKLKEVVEKRLIHIKVGQFPKRIIDQLKKAQPKNKVTNTKLYDYNEKLIKKMETANTFFLLQPSRKDSRYVCTTTEDLVEKGEISSNNNDLDVVVRNVLLRPLICFVKEPVKITLVYHTNLAAKNPLELLTGPSEWRQTRLSFDNSQKRGKKQNSLQVIIKKSNQLLNPGHVITTKNLEVDSDVRKYIATHPVSAKALVNSFFTERVPFPNEPFEVTTKFTSTA
jgi:hypothetical protein